MQDELQHTKQTTDPQRSTGVVCWELSDEDDAAPQTVIGQRSRCARALVGVGFLAVAGALATRRMTGGIALWPVALVPTWVGISHLVAAQIGYGGCPELGAIPSVFYGRMIITQCSPWQKIDHLLERK